jgi:beta-lactamase regulating signal transducer with metallopeptidase domain
MSGNGARAAALRKVARPGRRKVVIALCGAASDRILWFLIVLTGMVGLSPLRVLAAARDTIAARRERRASIATAPSEVWARQARRNAALANRGFALRRAGRRDL